MHVVTACSPKCYLCKSSGPGKCDDGQCFPRYGIDHDNHKCGGRFIQAITVFLFQARASAPRCISSFNILRYYDYSVHGENVLATHLCLVTLLNSEQCSQFERFCLHHAQMINKHSQYKNKINWQYCRGEQSYPQFPLPFSRFGQQTSRYKLLLGQFWHPSSKSTVTTLVGGTTWLE